MHKRKNLTRSKKLGLHRETLRRLDAMELRWARGGTGSDLENCSIGNCGPIIQTETREISRWCTSEFSCEVC